MKSTLYLLALLLFQPIVIPAATVERISRNDLHPLKDGMPGEQGLHKEILVAPGVNIPVEIQVTAKGNGYLEAANLKLKVFDSHDDGSYYEGGLLNIDFAEIHDDGKRELVISGIVCFTDEKQKATVRREAVVYIYALRPDGTFNEVFRNTNFRLDSRF
jgi:hypothetical protein